ncbi:hypothetical protein SZ64_15000 [Erythrobacter sp. SG61-1L]|uniref:hypothetical protein n=1 Tax=Erythrobacter sp. SG61-1L TaxID=1603897 RepID=UPI0006C8F426|nr:hypothetical protein [Erythrobacter sp. SG61-1L]KPL69297.1 hypothetical protein SZ64_15000 [Erythrobacter sp. SG61-1L]
MDYVSLLRNWHSKLEDVFTNLGNARAGFPVFALEHGLDRNELATLFDHVGSEIRRAGIDGRWNCYSLPAIVAATEVGYEYRGTGTDYWPLLEERLGAGISSSGRETLGDLFRNAHRRLGLKKPVDSAWTRTFRHIAWPIANAVAPREIQRPLAAALRQVVRFAPAGRRDSDFAEDLRYIARGSASSRFREWAEDQEITRTLIHHLLELPDPDSRLAAATVARLVGDLEADAEARSSVRSAISIHRQRRRATRTVSGPHGIATFALRPEDEGAYALFLRFPTIQQPFRNQIETALANHPGGLFLWGCVGPVSADLVLSGLYVRIESKAFADALIEGHAFLGISGDDEPDPLTDLSPNQALPMVFRRVPSGNTLAQIDETRILPDDRLVILTDRTPPLGDGLVEKAPVCGFSCIEVDLRANAARSFAERLGIRVPGRPVAEFVGGVFLAEGWRGPIYAAGFPLILKPAGAGESTVSVSVSKEDPVQVGPGEAVLLDLMEGEHAIRLVAGSQTSDALITILDAEPLPAAFDARPEPAEPTLDDLLAGRLVVRIFAPESVVGVSATLSLLADGYVLAHSHAVIPDLPCVLHGAHHLISALAEQVSGLDLPRDRQFRLQLKLGQYWSRSWVAGWSPRSCEWLADDGTWRAFADDAPLQIFPVPFEHPLANPDSCEEFESGKGFSLLVPFADATELTADGRIVGPSRLDLAQIHCDIPFALPRFVQANQEGVGLARLLDRYVGWTVAMTDNSITAAAGRIAASGIETALVRMLCGERWSREEARTEFLPGSRFRGLARTAWDKGLAKGDDLPALRNEQIPGLINLLADEIESCWKTEWNRPGDIVSDDFAEHMDTAVINAYEAFGAGLPESEREQFEDVDTWREPEAWLRALEKVQEMQVGTSLARMILPARRASRLQAADYYRFAPDEVVRLLDECHADLQSRNTPRWLSREHLQLAFWLWTAPAQVVSTKGWRQALVRLVDDRPTSRAVRYAALRFRASRGVNVAGQ